MTTQIITRSRVKECEAQNCIEGRLKAHYWQIEDPTGGLYSKGVCKYCKKEQMFRNSHRGLTSRDLSYVIVPNKEVLHMENLEAKEINLDIARIKWDSGIRVKVFRR